MSRPPLVHVLTQYAWPDDAPTGIYAEQVAGALEGSGIAVRLVAGTGRYREGRRPPPRVPVERVRHRQGRRESLPSVAAEYESVRRAFALYIEQSVEHGDVVILTSAPPTTLFLHRAIASRGATGVYWLHDYYPQLVRAVWDPPALVRRFVRRTWDRHLRAWSHVVKAAGNLAGPAGRLIRNWNTIDPGPERPARPRTALYSGNLGWGHHLPSFLATCRELVDQGYEVTVRGDGPGMRSLPGWVRSASLLAEPDALLRSLWEAEVHLVAGHPDLPDAVFPSKVWNSLAMGKKVVASGFAPAMLSELEEARRADPRSHLAAWVGFTRDLVGGASRSSGAETTNLQQAARPA